MRYGDSHGGKLRVRRKANQTPASILWLFESAPVNKEYSHKGRYFERENIQIVSEKTHTHTPITVILRLLNMNVSNFNM